VKLNNCGGTLISDRHVLTAYHCIKFIVEYLDNNWEGRTVKVSVHNTQGTHQKVPIATAKFPDKNDVGSHDIAMLVLAEPVTFDETIHPVCLPASDEIEYVGEKTMALGWGRTYYNTRSRFLKHVELTVAGWSSYIYGNNFFETRVEVIDSVPQDPCSGDSGGPLIHQDPTSMRWTIIGTLKGKGYNCKYEYTDGGGLWNKVTAHLDWINEVLEEDSDTSTCASKEYGRKKYQQGEATGSLEAASKSTEYSPSSHMAEMDLKSKNQDSYNQRTHLNNTPLDSLLLLD